RIEVAPNVDSGAHDCHGCARKRGIVAPPWSSRVGHPRERIARSRVQRRNPRTNLSSNRVEIADYVECVAHLRQGINLDVGKVLAVDTVHTEVDRDGRGATDAYGRKL